MFGLDSLAKVKMQGGIFGKAALVCIVLILGVSTVCISIGGWMGFILMLVMMGIVGLTLLGLMRFASINPFAAVMDGDALLAHARLVNETKDRGVVVQVVPDTDHPVPQLAHGAEDEADDAPQADEAEFTVVQHNPENRE